MKFLWITLIGVSLLGCKQQPVSEEQVVSTPVTATNLKKMGIASGANPESKADLIAPDFRGFVKETTGMDLETGQSMNDESGRLVKTVFPDQSVIRYQNGYPIEFLKPSGESTQFQFDENGKHLRTIHPDGRIEMFIYDAQGNKVKH
jgi:YD repeat-containing protein